MIEDITLDEVEYKNKIYFIELEATYELEKCECSSMCGDQYVTEKWQQINLEETDIKSVLTYDENDEEIYIKTNELSKDFLKIIEELSLEYIHDHL